MSDETKKCLECRKKKPKDELVGGICRACQDEEDERRRQEELLWLMICVSGAL